jgi:excisionase family DNA binding protein
MGVQRSCAVARRLLTIDQAAEELNVSRRYIRHLVFHRRISVVKLGRLVRIPAQVIDEIIEGGGLGGE